jgi:hypothetical protein
VATYAASPFPVDPADVPDDAVRFVKRTLLRHPGREPFDDYLARVMVAGLIAILAEPGADRETVEAAGALVSEYTAATGAVVTVQAVPAGGAPLSDAPLLEDVNALHSGEARP